MASGYGPSVVNDCAVSESEAQKILNRVMEFCGRTQNATRRIRTTADRLVGERPEAAEKSVSKPIRSGLIGNINDRLDDLDTEMRALEDAFMRIEGV